MSTGGIDAFSPGRPRVLSIALSLFLPLSFPLFPSSSLSLSLPFTLTLSLTLSHSPMFVRRVVLTVTPVGFVTIRKNGRTNSNAAQTTCHPVFERTVPFRSVCQANEAYAVAAALPPAYGAEPFAKRNAEKRRSQTGLTGRSSSANETPFPSVDVVLPSPFALFFSLYPTFIPQPSS